MRPPRAPRGNPAPCALACLADPRLQGLAPGLTIDHGRADADPRVFACCEAKGIRLLFDQDVTESCSLGRRLKGVRSLLARASSRRDGPIEALEPLSPSDQAATLKRLAAIAAGASRKGLAFVSGTGEGQPAVSMLSVAVAAAWRFGLTPHLVRVGVGESRELYPPKTDRDAGLPVLLLEGLDALWEPMQLETLEAVIGYAYRSMTPLFVTVKLPPDRPSASEGAGPRLTRGAFSSKIAGVKARSPARWLSPDGLSKWPAVTDGLQALGTQAKGNRGRQAAAKLPWDMDCV